MIITFCGHSKINFTNELYDTLMETIEKFVKANPNCTFYLGGYGDFDYLCRKALKQLQKTYIEIKFIFVTPYINPNYSKLLEAKSLYDECIYPPIEHIPKRFAIIERNKWMINNADVIIGYIKFLFGGVFQSLEFAKRKNKLIINLAK